METTRVLCKQTSRLEPSHSHFPFASSSFRLPFVDASGVGGFGGWLGASMAGGSLYGHLIKSMTKLRQLKASCSNWSSRYVAYTQRCLLDLSNCR